MPLRLAGDNMFQRILTWKVSNVTAAWDSRNVFNSDELRVLRGIYDDITAEPWFSDLPAAREQFALHILHIYRRGLVIPEKLRSFSMISAQKKFAKHTFAGKLQGRRILVEDDFLDRGLPRPVPQPRGCHGPGPAGSLDTAVKLLNSNRLQLAVALLDIRLEHNDVFPLADTLQARHVPFAFVSAFDDRIPERFTDVRRFRKPANPHEIVDYLASRRFPQDQNEAFGV